MKEPWETEDWRKAKGIIADDSQTNSALARRDYSVPCKTPGENLIVKVEGYWIWWCSAHHQPLAQCELAKTRLAVQFLREALETSDTFLSILHSIMSMLHPQASQTKDVVNQLSRNNGALAEADKAVPK